MIATHTVHNSRLQSSFWNGVKFLLLVPTALWFLYFTLYTKYAPDIYVFVQYAYKDNLDRNITISSIINNTFLFDILTVFGDTVDFYSHFEWLYLIAFISCAAFVIKYAFLISKIRFLSAITVYFASFFYDLNQVRFNISTLLVVFGVMHFGRRRGWLGLLLAFTMHIMPVLIFAASYASRNVVKSALLTIPAILLFAGAGWYNYVGQSRIFDYFSLELGSYPKTLLLIIPVSVFLLQTKGEEFLQIQVISYAKIAFLVGILLLPFNYETTARFFEIAFIAIACANGMSAKRPLIDFMLLGFAVSVFASRLMGGISSQAKFADLYMLTW